MSRREGLAGVVAVLAVVCCAVLPAGAGAIAGATLAGPLGLGVAILVAGVVATVIVLLLRRRRGQAC